MNKPLIIGITGGSGSGKTLFLRELLSCLNPGTASVLSMDNYYKPRSEQPKDEKGIENFDQPESIDEERIVSDLRKLKSGENVSLTEYTFNNDSKKPAIIHIDSAPIIMVEGIFTFHYEQVCALLDLKIFVEAPEYLMLTRRITRDAEERGYDLSDVLYRFQHHVTPSFKRYIEPSKYSADLIIPNHDGFKIALDVVSNYLKKVLD